MLISPRSRDSEVALAVLTAPKAWLALNWKVNLGLKGVRLLLKIPSLPLATLELQSSCWLGGLVPRPYPFGTDHFFQVTIHSPKFESVGWSPWFPEGWEGGSSSSAFPVDCIR